MRKQLLIGAVLAALAMSHLSRCGELTGAIWIDDRPDGELLGGLVAARGDAAIRLETIARTALAPNDETAKPADAAGGKENVPHGR